MTFPTDKTVFAFFVDRSLAKTTVSTVPSSLDYTSGCMFPLQSLNNTETSSYCVITVPNPSLKWFYEQTRLQSIQQLFLGQNFIQYSKSSTVQVSMNLKTENGNEFILKNENFIVVMRLKGLFFCPSHRKTSNPLVISPIVGCVYIFAAPARITMLKVRSMVCMGIPKQFLENQGK